MRMRRASSNASRGSRVTSTRWPASRNACSSSSCTDALSSTTTIVLRLANGTTRSCTRTVACGRTRAKVHSPAVTLASDSIGATFRLLDQTVADRQRDCVRAAVCTELRQHPLHVGLDRIDREVQSARDGAVFIALADE